MNEHEIERSFKSITSFSHILGCVTALLVDYIRTAFNDEYFKTIRTTTEVPYVERSAWFKDIMAKPRPMMIIDPKFDPSDEPGFLPQSEFDQEIPNDTSDDIWIGSSRAVPLLLDDDHKYELYFKARKYKMSFSIVFIFDSEVQRMQSQEYIRQTIRHRIPIIVNRFIENNIPKHFMQAIAGLEGMNVNDSEFMEKINKITSTPLSHRLRTGNGNKEFFALEHSQLMIRFNSPPSSNGAVKKGNIIVSSSFSEDVTIEFPAHSTYFLKTHKNIGESLDMSEIAILEENSMKAVAVQKFFIREFPVFSDFEDGMKKLAEFVIQADTDGDDTLNLFEYINSDVQKVVTYYRNQGMDIDFIKVGVCENVARLDGSRAIFDCNTLDLTIKDMSVYNSYTAVIYINNTTINTLKQSLFAFEDYERLKK